MTLLFVFLLPPVWWMLACPHPRRQVVRVSEAKRCTRVRGIISSPVGAEWIFAIPDALPVLLFPRRCRFSDISPRATMLLRAIITLLTLLVHVSIHLHSRAG